MPYARRELRLDEQMRPLTRLVALIHHRVQMSLWWAILFGAWTNVHLPLNRRWRSISQPGGT